MWGAGERKGPALARRARSSFSRKTIRALRPSAPPHQGSGGQAGDRESRPRLWDLGERGGQFLFERGSGPRGQLGELRGGRQGGVIVLRQRDQVVEVDVAVVGEVAAVPGDVAGL